MPASDDDEGPLAGFRRARDPRGHRSMPAIEDARCGVGHRVRASLALVARDIVQDRLAYPLQGLVNIPRRWTGFGCRLALTSFTLRLFEGGPPRRLGFERVDGDVLAGSEDACEALGTVFVEDAAVVVRERPVVVVGEILREHDRDAVALFLQPFRRDKRLPYLVGRRQGSLALHLRDGLEVLCCRIAHWPGGARAVGVLQENLQWVPHRPERQRTEW